ncbi:MAG: flagellar motor switch protein FliN [Candidatus Electryonea clarkiae]|nr:flagellar motor switch protein FliN [Candidatus Electryonea clarkiae]MDP8287312.1 flagellar motor switch protein FliN [Candidatus Electryonea clarkiae]
MVTDQKINVVEDLSLSTVKDVLGPILNRNVNISIGDISDSASPKYDADALGNTLGANPVFVEAPVEGAVSGSIYYIFSQKLAAAITDLMVMGDGTAPFNEDESLDGITEATNQIVGALATNWTEQIGADVRASGANAEVVDLSSLGVELDKFIQVEYLISIEDWGDETFIKLISSEIEEVLSQGIDEDMMGGVGIRTDPDDEIESASSKQGSTRGEPTVHPAEFAPFDDAGPGRTAEETRNLDLLLDISLPVTIELGRTNMLIRDVLEIGPGSVIELQKLSGEPVDLYVNDKKFALGEVVVIDENFGIRITELLKVEDRIQALR